MPPLESRNCKITIRKAEREIIHEFGELKKKCSNIYDTFTIEASSWFYYIIGLYKSLFNIAVNSSHYA
jgi:hypothetical protein